MKGAGQRRAGGVERASGAFAGAVLGLVLAAPVAIAAADVVRDGRWILYGGFVLGAVAGSVAVDVAGARTGNARRRGALDGTALIASVARRDAEGRPGRITGPLGRVRGTDMLRRAFGGNTKGRARAGVERPRAGFAAEAAGEAREGEHMDRQRERDWNAGTPSVGASELNALLGKGSEFDGKLAFEGTVRIDGDFTGEITTSDTLIVGDGAKVQAEITCGSIVVHGEVVGNVKATQAVELHKPARLKGDVTTPSLMIERGVVFEGRSQMESSAASKIIPLAASGGDRGD